MSYDQFVAKWTGVGADFDGAYGFQCVDLFNFYNRDVVGQGFVGTPTTGGAADLWNDYTTLDGYTKVANSPTGVPPKGAVVIWAANTKATGAAGHVGIASGEGDADYFVSFDQNYPTGSLPHMQRHTYEGVLGWYVPNDNQGTNTMDEEAAKDVYRLGLHREPENDQVWRAFMGMKFEDAAAIVRAGTEWLTQNDVLLRAYPLVEQQLAEAHAKIADLTNQGQSQQAAIDVANKHIDALTSQLTAAEAAQALPAPQPSTTATTTPASTPTAPVAAADPNSFTVSQLFGALMNKLLGKS
jgi:hypothetical protein